MFLISSLKQSKNSDVINEYLQILKKPNIHEYLRILKPEVTNSRSMVKIIYSTVDFDAILTNLFQINL